MQPEQAGGLLALAVAGQPLAPRRPQPERPQPERPQPEAATQAATGSLTECLRVSHRDFGSESDHWSDESVC